MFFITANIGKERVADSAKTPIGAFICALELEDRGATNITVRDHQSIVYTREELGMLANYLSQHPQEGRS